MLGSTGREFCTSQISVRFGTRDWGRPSQLTWSMEKEAASIFLMAICKGLMTVFCSRLKGVGNYSPKSNTNDIENSETVFMIINYVWAMGCWFVSRRAVSTCTGSSVPDIWLPKGLRTFLGRDRVSVQFLPLRLMHFLLMALLWWISPACTPWWWVSLLTGSGKIASTDTCEEVNMRRGGVILGGWCRAGEASFPWCPQQSLASKTVFSRGPFCQLNSGSGSKLSSGRAHLCWLQAVCGEQSYKVKISFYVEPFYK